MNTNVNRMKESCPEVFCKESFHEESALEDLYWHYFGEHPLEPQEIRKRFADLAGILNKLPLQEHDQVWNITCALCMEHEKAGFLEGVRLGAALVAELLGEMP